MLRVAVVGCGAMGAATGWRLAARGVDVTCFDRFSPPHDLGSSHGETRITRTAYFEGESYVPLLQETFPLWRQLERESGMSLVTMNGALMIGPPGGEVVAGAVAAAKKHRLEAQIFSAAEVRSRYPGHVLVDTEVAVLDLQAGFLDPEASVGAMINRVTSLGGSVRRDEPVIHINSHADGVEVVTAAGPQTFDRAVVSVGARVGGLIPWLPVTVERQVMAWFRVQPDTAWFRPERFPVYLHETSDLGDIYGFPSLDGQTVKLARHHDGETTDPDTVRRQVTEADLAPLRDFITTRLHGVSVEVQQAVVCMYTNAPDGHFIVDSQPADPRIVVVSACSGHGFKFAPVIGDIAADLAVDGTTGRDIRQFSLARLQLPAPGLGRPGEDEPEPPPLDRYAKSYDITRET